MSSFIIEVVVVVYKVVVNGICLGYALPFSNKGQQQAHQGLFGCLFRLLPGPASLWLLSKSGAWVNHLSSTGSAFGPFSIL